MFADTTAQQYEYPKIRALMEKSERYRWSLDDDIEWDQTPQIPEGIPVEVYRDMVSQLYYAEVATIEVCSRLEEVVADLEEDPRLSGVTFNVFFNQKETILQAIDGLKGSAYWGGLWQYSYDYEAVMPREMLGSPFQR